MDQSLVHTFSWGHFVWTNGPESSSKVSPYSGIGPWMSLPSEVDSFLSESSNPTRFHTPHRQHTPDGK